MTDLCICEGPQKIGPGYHRPDCPAGDRHTPGPWVVNDFCTEGGADTAVWTSHDPHTAKSICECHFETHANLMRGEIGCHELEAEANARLIAAAPDLLMALRQTVAALNGRPCRQQALDDAMRAILKATLNS